MLNIIMSALLALVIVAGIVFGSQFLALAPLPRNLIAGAVLAVFGTWIVVANIRRTS